MPGFNQATAAYQARNGNTCGILIGTVLVAFAQQVNHGAPLGTEALYGVGSAKPQELQQLRVSPRITIEAFALTPTGQTLLANNQNLTYLLANNQFDIYLYDSNSNTVLYTYVACTAQDFAESVGANQIVRDTFSFLAMDVLDNKGNSILNVPEAFTPATTQVAATAAQAATGSLGIPTSSA
jgi:hypothetical protein